MKMNIDARTPEQPLLSPAAVRRRTAIMRFSASEDYLPS
jgi:hypothetical protein